MKVFDDTLRIHYWPEDEKVFKHSMKDLICGGRWNSDEDVVKVAALYFIYFYLLSSRKDFLIDDDFNIVDFGFHNVYPWDLLCFTKLRKMLKYHF